MVSNSSPSFLPGTYVLVQPEGFDLVSGKYYIARHRDGETTFKQYVYDAGKEYLAPLNPAFETIQVKDDWEFIGRVIDVKVTGL
ncbi:Peptidase S24-like protein [compost metagenome]